MTKQPREEEKLLIRKIQQGFAYVDVRTGNVYAQFDDWTCTGNEYLGTLRRKYIPNRRNIEKVLSKMSQAEIEERKNWEEIAKRPIFIFWGELGRIQHEF